MTAVYSRELNGYFKSMTGYLFSAFLLLFAGIYMMVYNLSGYTAKFETVLSAISFIYLIAVPILTMRSMAEEKKQKTDQLLYSLPLSLSKVVLGKYLAMATVLLAPVLVMGLYPAILSQFGTVSFGAAYGALAGFFLLGACLLSIGLFVSSVTENQVASAVITLVVLLILYFMSGLSGYVSTTASASLTALLIVAVALCAALYLLTRNAPVSVLALALVAGGLFLWYQSDAGAFVGLFNDVMERLSLFDRFDAFVDGVFDLTAVVYYTSITGVFLFLTVQALEKRRWSE